MVPYSQTIASRIFREIGGGRSLASVCAGKGMPSRTAVYKWIDDIPEFAEGYARAQRERGEYYGHRVAQIGNSVEAGKLRPDVGRVAIDAYKWTAARMASKNWGDKTAHEHSGPGGTPIAINGLDLSKLSAEDLAALEALLSKAGGGK